MIDSRSCWAAGLWSGVVKRLILERLVDSTKGPYSARARAADAACIKQAVAANPYLEDVGKEALTLLGKS